MLPCCPLLEPTEEDLFSRVASGTLLQVRETHFLLTAGHVCDQLAESNFIFPSAEGFSTLHGDVVTRVRKEPPDLYDFGFVLLDNSTATELKHFFTFAQPKDVDVNEGE